jgi:hypothetical protein
MRLDHQPIGAAAAKAAAALRGFTAVCPERRPPANLKRKPENERPHPANLSMKKLFMLCALCALSGCKSSTPVSVEGSYTTGQTNIQGGVVVGTNGTTIFGDYTVPGTNVQGSATIGAGGKAQNPPQ